ncbi:MAG: cyclic nucleotide-binding domain-containing protein [Bacteroidetes bacterium]|nr:cyclic nucleotide-binding domain-containing protein [Bacteroidota bacterium]
MTEQVKARNNLWDNFFRKRDGEESSVKHLLSSVPIFSQLTDKELSKIESIVHHRKYRADEYVFAQGDPGLGMYIIEEGEVVILHSISDGTIKELAKLKDGDFFGELSLLDESPRSASAVANTPSSIIGFFRPDLLDLLTRSPKAGTKILLKLGEVIGTRLRVTNEQLSKLSAEMESRNSNK